MKILIVEDEVKTREGMEMLVRYLSPSDEVTTAECGQMAIELCSKHFYDLIFTDIKMPGMDGFQMLSQLDRKGRMIVIVSGYADFSYAQQAIHFSVLDYVLKPVSAVKIKEVLVKAGQKLTASRNGCFYSYLTSHSALSEEDQDYYWNKMDVQKVYSLISVRKEGTAGEGKIQEKIKAGLRMLQTESFLSILYSSIKGWYYILISAASQCQCQEGVRRLLEYTGGGDGVNCFPITERREDLIGFYNKLAKLAENEERGWELSNPVRVARDFVQQNIETNMSLAMLAEIAHVHPAYLSTLFKKETGKNLTDFIVDCRIERAIELLKNPDYKIYEVAVAVGYSDAKYFSNVFKNALGVTPREWRARELKQAASENDG